MNDETPHNAPFVTWYHPGGGRTSVLLEAGVAYALEGDFSAAFTFFDEIIGCAPPGSTILKAALQGKGKALAIRARVFHNRGDINLSRRYLDAARGV